MVVVDISISQTENIQPVGPAHSYPLPVHLLHYLAHRGGDAVKVVAELFPSFDTARVEQNRQRVDNRIHVV